MAKAFHCSPLEIYKFDFDDFVDYLAIINEDNKLQEKELKKNSKHKFKKR